MTHAAAAATLGTDRPAMTPSEVIAEPVQPPPGAASASGLQAVQVQAVILLASGTGITKTATEIGVSRRTVMRWRLQPRFAAALEQEMAVTAAFVREAAQAELLGMTERALAVVRGALESDGPMALAAARLVLQRTDAMELKAPTLAAPTRGAPAIADSTQRAAILARAQMARLRLTGEPETDRPARNRGAHPHSVAIDTSGTGGAPSVP